jgi:HEAT repeat protein
MNCPRWLTIITGAVLVLLLRDGRCVGAETGRGLNVSDEQLLRRAKVRTDNESLLGYLRAVSQRAETDRLVESLIQDLGDADFRKRERAQQRLMELGTLAVPRLRENRDNADVEIARRVKACLGEIDRLPLLNVPLIVVRLLVQRGTEGAVPTFIDYLGNTSDQDIEEEIYYGLDALALRDGRVHPALLGALRNSSPARRAVAACILGRAGDAKQKEDVRRLLTDPDSKVRLRAAQGLLASKDTAAVPVLLGLLDEPSVEIGWQAEELLHWIAGEEGPDLVVGAGTPAERRRCQAAWRQWWEGRKGVIDWPLIERDCRLPGLVLLWHGKDENRKGETQTLRFLLCGCDGAERWTTERILDSKEWWRSAASIWWTGKGLLLPKGAPASQIREEDLLGKALWESERCPVMEVMDWVRLGDGRTLVSDGKLLLELDARGGKVGQRELPEFTDERMMEFRQRMGPWPRPKYRHRRWRGRGEVQGATFGREGRTLVKWQDYYLLEYDTGTGELIGVEVAPEHNAALPGWRDQPLTNGLLGLGERVQRRDGGTVIGVNGFPEYEELLPHRLVPAEIDRRGKRVWEGPPLDTMHVWVQVVYPLVRFGFKRALGAEASVTTIASRLRLLKSRRQVFRLRAARALYAAPPSKEIGSAFLEVLQDPDHVMRLIAVEAVFKSRKHLQGVLPQFTALLKDEAVWMSTFECLNRWGEEAVPVLLRLMDDTKQPQRVRVRAAMCLPGHIDEQQPGVIRGLRRALKEGSAKDRANVVWALQQHPERGGDRFLPELLLALRDPNEELSFIAGVVLGSLGPKAEKAVPDLLDALGDKKSRFAAATALEKIRPAATVVVPRLVEQLHVKDDLRGRICVIGVLGGYGVAAGSAVPRLLEIVKDRKEDADTRIAAVSVLKEIDPEVGKKAQAILKVKMK